LSFKNCFSLPKKFNELFARIFILSTSERYFNRKSSNGQIWKVYFLDLSGIKSHDSFMKLKMVK